MDAAGVRDLLHRWWGLTTVAVEPLGGGMNSTTWFVEHDGQSYVAKRVTTPALHDFVAGCEAAAALADAGFVTGRPMPATDGRFVVTEHALALLEYVPGRQLTGETAEEQRWIAGTLAGVHLAGGPVSGPGGEMFADWLTTHAPGVDEHAWLPSAIQAVRDETAPLVTTWSVLHTDPAPEAFRHDDSTAVTGLIDWSGARRGPILYDVASAVMYLGGPEHAAPFLDAYRAQGPLGDDEMRALDVFRRFRWVVQSVYFAGRLAVADLTGVAGQADNEKGLDDARRGLAELGLDTT